MDLGLRAAPALPSAQPRLCSAPRAAGRASWRPVPAALATAACVGAARAQRGQGSLRLLLRQARRPSGTMEGIEAPKAERPAAPCQLSTGLLTSSPSFAGHSEELEELKEASRRLQDMTSKGRQLAYLALARMLRSDMEGAAASIASINALPGPQEVLGAKFWERPEVRLQVCQASGIGFFMEIHIAALAMESFLKTGIITPRVPENWLVGVRDYDDELYLLGVLTALRELERYATNRGQELDLRSVRVCLATALCLEQALMQFSFRNSDLRQRFDGVKYQVKKLESVSYEIDLALQRAAASGSAPEVPAVPSEELPASAGSVVDLAMLNEIKERYEAFDEQREQVMKRSRDIVKGAKNAIYALHRDDYKKAENFLKQCAKDSNELYSGTIGSYPRLRDGFFSGTLEELAEAHVYWAFRAERKLLTFAELQERSGLEFPMTLTEYLGGIMDLTGEVARMAVRAASGGRKAKADVEVCLACVDAVYNGLQELPTMPGSKLNKKIGPLKQTLSKIEGVLYELALLSQGVVARPREDAPDADDMKD